MSLTRRPLRRSMAAPMVAAMVAMLLAAPMAIPAAAQRTELEPGWNLFSPQQDVEMGRQVSAEAEAELPIITDEVLSEYINRLGQQLASEAPGERYPYQFKLVNDKAINAFALPGGFIYINRGIIETADREAEVAGVIGHEIAHVALRHGTNQASKAYAAQAPLALLGGLFGGGNSIGSVIAQLGIGFGASSLFNKFSRDAETQSDLMGAQILYDVGYDPTGMTEFFEKLEAQGGGGPEFLSSHPNPGNRRGNVAAEIGRLGGSRSSYIDNSAEFRRIKERLASMPEASGGDRGGAAPAGGAPTPEAPSEQWVGYEGARVRLSFPANWSTQSNEESVTFFPERGMGADGALAYGLIASVFDPARQGRNAPSIEDATDQLLTMLGQSNPDMRVVQGYRRTRIGGRSARSVVLSNSSPFGGAELDWLSSVYGPDGRLYYFIAVAPESAFQTYEPTFRRALESVRFR